MNTNPLIIILLGRSGCGKGTQADLIREKYGLEYIGTGDELRKRSEISDFSGKKIKEFLNQGGFVPTGAVAPVYLNKLEEYKNNYQNLKGIIIDGSPRKLFEAQLIDEALKWYEWDKNVKVLLIDISEEEAFNRLTKRRICKNCGKLIPYIGHYKNLKVCDQCGGQLITRPDDTEEAIRVRLDEFNKETQPVIEYYQNQNRLIKINGEQSIEKVHQDILKAIGK